MLVLSIPSMAQTDSIIPSNHKFAEDCDSDSIFAYQNPLTMKKRFFKAGVEAFGLNMAVQSFDRFVLNADYAKISFSSILHHITNGFVRDNDQFSTMLFAHP